MRRAERRRRRREREHADRRISPEPFEVLGVEQLRQDILNAIMSLPGPQQEVIFDRFYNDLPPRVIASRRNLKLETVKSRQKLALRALRKALDARYGSRETWALTIVSLAGFTSLGEVTRALAKGKVATASLPALPVGLSVAAVLAALALTAVMLWNGGEAAPPDTIARGDPPEAGGIVAGRRTAPVEGAAGNLPADEEPTPALIGAEPVPARERSDPPADPTATARVGHVSGSLTIGGRVLDVESAPVAGAVLCLSNADEDANLVRSTIDGSYSVDDVPPGTWRLECHAQGFLRQEYRFVVGGAKGAIEKSFHLERARETRVRIETPAGESFSRLRAQRVDASEINDFRRRPFDWLDPGHFSVVATDRDWDASLPSLSGVVRRFPGGEYSPRPGTGEYCGKLMTEIATNVPVRLYYRHVHLLGHDRQYAEGVPEEITFRVDPDAELRPLLSQLTVRVTDATTGQPLPARVHVRGLYETAGAESGVPTSEADGAISFVNRVPGYSIVEVSAADALLGPGERWSATRIAYLPPGEAAEPVTVPVGPPRRLAVRCVTEDGATVTAQLQCCLLEPDFPRPAHVGEGTGFRIANGIEDNVQGLIIRETVDTMLVTATALHDPGLASAPAALDPRDLPQELTFVFERAARPCFRFAQEKTRCHLAVLLTNDGLPAWSREVEGPTEVTAAVLPGEYALVLYQRRPSGELQEVDRRSVTCEADEVFLAFE